MWDGGQLAMDNRKSATAQFVGRAVYSAVFFQKLTPIQYHFMVYEDYVNFFVLDALGNRES